MSEFKPLPENPTNTDLAFGIRQLHDCFEQYKQVAIDANLVLSSQIKSVSDNLEVHRKSATEGIKQVDDKVERILGEQSQVKTALGVESKRKPVGLISQTRLIIAIVAATTAAGSVLRFAVFAWPYIWTFIKAWWHYTISN